MLNKLFFSLILLVILTASAIAQQVEQVTLHCPVYLTWPGFESFIVVRNTTGKDVGVTPGFCFDGNHLVPYTLITVPAHGTILLTAQQFLDTSACESGLIGLELMFTDEPGAIMASVVMFYGGLSFQVPFRDAAGDLSRTLHASLCLGGDYIDYIFVKNTTDNRVTVSPLFYCNGVSTPGLDMNLEAYQTAMLNASLFYTGERIGGADLYSSGQAGSIIAVNVSANLTAGRCLVEELLPGVAGFVPQTYDLFVANGLSYTLSAINTANGQIDDNFAGTGDAPNYLAFHSDVLYCVNSLSNNIQAFSPGLGDVLAEIELDVGTNPWAMAFASDDKAYVTGYLTNNVVILDVESSQVRGTIPLGDDARSPEGLCFADGKLYVSSVNYDMGTYTYGQGIVTVIEAETDEIIKTIQTTQVNPQAIVSDNQGEIYVLCTGDWFSQFGVVDVIDSTTDEISQSLLVGGSPMYIEIAPNGCAYIGDAVGPKIYKIDVVDNTVLRDSNDPILFGGASSYASGLVSSDLGYLYISSFPDDTIYIMDWRTDGMIRMMYPVGDGPGALAMRE
ncbi:MAG: YncE family protein [Candidatus Coatesbacteria bacterium]|nr:YncE family protein [Candidatus Coatesbacteria bacterium]